MSWYRSASVGSQPTLVPVQAKAQSAWPHHDHVLFTSWPAPSLDAAQCLLPTLQLPSPVCFTWSEAQQPALCQSSRDLCQLQGTRQMCWGTPCMLRAGGTTPVAAQTWCPSICPPSVRPMGRQSPCSGRWLSSRRQGRPLPVRVSAW